MPKLAGYGPYKALAGFGLAAVYVHGIGMGAHVAAGGKGLAYARTVAEHKRYTLLLAFAQLGGNVAVSVGLGCHNLGTLAKVHIEPARYVIQLASLSMPSVVPFSTRLVAMG